MDYTQIYVVERNLKSNIITLLNHVRIYKKMILLRELVGMCRNKKTKEFHEVLSISSLMWLITFLIIPKLSNKLIEI